MPGHVDERERLAHWQSQFPVATRQRFGEFRSLTTGRCLPVGSSCCATSTPFISARAALPLSTAVVRSFRWIALTIALTCGMARLNTTKSGRCEGLSEPAVLYARYDGRVIWCISYKHSLPNSVGSSHPV